MKLHHWQTYHSTIVGPQNTLGKVSVPIKPPPLIKEHPWRATSFQTIDLFTDPGGGVLLIEHPALTQSAPPGGGRTHSKFCLVWVNVGDPFGSGYPTRGSTPFAANCPENFSFFFNFFYFFAFFRFFRFHKMAPKLRGANFLKCFCDIYDIPDAVATSPE